MQRNPPAQALYVWSSMAVLLLIGWHWAQPPTTIAQIDLVPPYDAANMLGKCAAAWNHVHSFIGSVDNCFSWTPHYALQALLQLALGASYGQAAIFVLPVMLSWLGAFKCARCLGASPFAAFVAAWMYAFNPARQSMIGVFATGEVCAALLPWVFYWVMLAALEPRRRWFAAAALITVSFAALVILAITPQLLVALLLGTIVWLAFAVTLAPDRGAFLSWAGKTALLVTAAALWWIVPNALSYVGVAITHTADPMSVAWTFARASLLNELRFTPMWFWQYPEYNPWAVELERNALLYAAAFVPALGVAAGLLLARGRAVGVVRFLALFALVMLYIAKGTHPPLAAINLAFFRIPGMFLFIEPYGAILIAALCAALACGIAADRLANRSTSGWSNLAAAAVGVFFVGAATCANFASVTGAVFHEQFEPLPGVHIRLPDYWRALAARLNAEPAPGGVAILPVDDFYQVDYDWGLHGADLLPVTLLHRAVLMPGSPLTYTQTQESRTVNGEIAQAIAARSADAARLLREVGVRFVVVRNDVRLAHAFAPSAGEYARSFGRPAAVFGPLELFDLGLPASGVRLVDAAEISSAPPRPAATELPTTRVVQLDQTKAGSSAATPVPAVASRVAVTSTSIAADVVNPGANTLTCDVLVGVWPRSATTYELRTSDGQQRSAMVTSTERPQWARFVGVALAPGTTHLMLSEPSTIDRRLAFFMTPRLVQDSRSKPHVAQIEFANVMAARAATSHAAPISGAASYSSPSTGFTLDTSLADDPTVAVHPKAGTSLGSAGWLLDVSVDGTSYRCFADIDDGVRYQLDDVVQTCLRGEGRALTTDDQRASRVNRMWLGDRYAGGPEETVTIETTPPYIAASAPMTANHERPLASTNLPLALGNAVVIGASGRNDIATFEAFSPTWVAIEVGRRVSILPHVEALVWRNVWTVAGPGTIYIVNWLVLAQWSLLAVGLVIVLLAWRRR